MMLIEFLEGGNIIGFKYLFLLLMMVIELWWSKSTTYNLDISIAIHVQPNLDMYIIEVRFCTMEY